MFKQAELTANGIELIDQSSSTYNYKSVIESILSFNRESKNCHLKTAIFAKDLPDSATQNKEANSDTTSGYFIRKQQISESKIVSFLTTLHIDFLNSSRLLPPGIQKISITNLTLKLIL